MISLKKLKSEALAISLMVAGVVLVIGVIVGIMYGLRMFSMAATPITVHQVKPNVECAVMVTGDGAAIDCWKS